MRAYMLWRGGANFASPELERDLEEFDSLRALKDAFWRRSEDRFYVYPGDAEPENGGSEGFVYLRDPRGERDPYPDRLVFFGPRGGVRLERC